VVLLLLLGWWLGRRRGKEVAPTAQAEAAAPTRTVEAPPPAAAPAPAPTPAPAAETAAPPTPDDLKRIEGIGPKISGLLQTAGITTFAQLAAADVGRLRQILAEANLTALADPATWAEQARLAAAGQWEALEALQQELKGGRRA
jgi:predicted flap endonuclease-1-like 5' DNA nuclease